eukprot:11283343-Alexandrium_andersonii.AAC.1
MLRNATSARRVRRALALAKRAISPRNAASQRSPRAQAAQRLALSVLPGPPTPWALARLGGAGYAGKGLRAGKGYAFQPRWAQRGFE